MQHLPVCIVELSNQVVVDVHVSHSIDSTQDQVYRLLLQDVLGSIQLSLESPGLLRCPGVGAVIVPAIRAALLVRLELLLPFKSSLE